jgi:hypothetical protein
MGPTNASVQRVERDTDCAVALLKEPIEEQWCARGSVGESTIAGCERCRPGIANAVRLADVLDKRCAFEFVLTETAACPSCRPLSEKTLVAPHGGIEMEAGV